MKTTIAFITDMHLREPLPVDVNQQQNWLRVLEDAQRRNVDFIVIGGDISEADEYASFVESMLKTRRPFYVIPGNHDAPATLLKFFPNPENADLAELYYSFSDDNFLYLFLDSSSGEISEPQLRWLERKLSENHLKVLLFVHHPIYEVDSYVDRKYPLQNRESVKRIIENQQKEVFIFCGHYHCEDETGSGAISQYVTPAVSYQVAKHTETLNAEAGYFGYRLIALESANVTHELIIFTP